MSSSKIVLSINAETPEELKEIIHGLSGTVGVVKEQVKADADTKKDKPKKQDKKVEDKPVKDPEPDAPEEDEANKDTEKEEIPSVEDVRAAAKKASDAGKKDEIMELLAEFNQTVVSKIPKDQRAEFLAKLEAL